MIPRQDRDMNHLSQLIRGRAESWLAAVRKAGFQVQVIETFRTAARQDYLYSQGRSIPGPVVTQTRDSAHEYGVALDWMPLRWNGEAWVGSWDRALYSRIYAAVPPGKHGLEILTWEMPHVQLLGVNGSGQMTPVSVWAQAHGLQANAQAFSQWPLPGVGLRGKPMPVSKQVGRVMVPNPAGGWQDVKGQRVQVGGVVVNAVGADVWVAPGRGI